MDHSADVARAVAAGVLGVYIVWRAASVLMLKFHTHRLHGIYKRQQYIYSGNVAEYN